MKTCTNLYFLQKYFLDDAISGITDIRNAQEQSKPTGSSTDDDVILVNDEDYAFFADDPRATMDHESLSTSGSQMYGHRSQDGTQHIQAGVRPTVCDNAQCTQLPRCETSSHIIEDGHRPNLHSNDNISDDSRYEPEIARLLGELTPYRSSANSVERKYIRDEINVIPTYAKPARELSMQMRAQRLRYELSLWATIRSLDDDWQPSSGNDVRETTTAGSIQTATINQPTSDYARTTGDIRPGETQSSLPGPAGSPKPGTIPRPTGQSTVIQSDGSQQDRGQPTNGSETPAGNDGGPTYHTYGWCCAGCPQCWGETQIDVEEHHIALVRILLDVVGDPIPYADRIASTFTLDTRNKNHMLIKPYKQGRPPYWQETSFYTKMTREADILVPNTFPFHCFREIGLKFTLKPVLIKYEGDTGENFFLRYDQIHDQKRLEVLAPPKHKREPHLQGYEPQTFDGIFSFVMECTYDYKPVIQRQLLYKDDIFAQRLKNILNTRDKLMDSQFGKLAKIMYAFEEYQRDFDKQSDKIEPPYKPLNQPFAGLTTNPAPLPLHYHSESSSPPKEKKAAPAEKSAPDKARRKKPAKTPEPVTTPPETRQQRQILPQEDFQTYATTPVYPPNRQPQNPWVLQPRPIQSRLGPRPYGPPPIQPFR
jgi:hypothetical protein